MKILLANKFYYRRGGDCIYTLNLEALLKAGESVIFPFGQFGKVHVQRQGFTGAQGAHGHPLQHLAPINQNIEVHIGTFINLSKFIGAKMLKYRSFIVSLQRY